MIETTHLFPILHQQLVQLLKSLSDDEWNKKTVARLWTVKDVAAHILDTNLRSLSLSRDKLTLVPTHDIDSYASLVTYLNQLNAEWVNAFKRISPQVLILLIETAGKQYSEHLLTLDPYAKAHFPVAWAGEHESNNWFHIAREYTENWHHQQQIRDATGRPGIMTKELFYPVMDTFMHGLPHTYQHTTVAVGTVIQITIDSDIGGDWIITKKENAWHLSKTVPQRVDASIILEPDTAWKLFTKAVSADEIRKKVIIQGNETLASVALKLVAVMA
jgi:uncharacterized protein (TIGR03083 family)